MKKVSPAKQGVFRLTWYTRCNNIKAYLSIYPVQKSGYHICRYKWFHVILYQTSKQRKFRKLINNVLKTKQNNKNKVYKTLEIYSTLWVFHLMLLFLRTISGTKKRGGGGVKSFLPAACKVLLVSSQKYLNNYCHVTQNMKPKLKRSLLPVQ